MRLINKIKIWKIKDRYLENEYIYMYSYVLSFLFYFSLIENFTLEKIILLLFVNTFASLLTFFLLAMITCILDYYIGKSILKEINNINKNNENILIDYLINSKNIDLLFENIENINIQSMYLILNNKEAFKEILNKFNTDYDCVKELYNLLKETINESNNNIESIAFLFLRMDTELLSDIKQKLYIKYEQNIKTYKCINDILESSLSKFEILYLLSKNSIQDIFDNMDLIKSLFKENELIIFDIFNEMSIEKKLECLKNEKFSIYIKDMYELIKESKNYYLINMYDIYFKELCLFVQEKELKDYYSILSYIFKDVKEEEIKSIQYRSNVLIENNKNVEHKNIIKI